MKCPFLGYFLGPNSPKYCLILLKFSPDVVSKERKTVFKNFWKIQYFTKSAHSQILPFFKVFAQLWPHFTLWRRSKSNKLNGCQEKIFPSGYRNIAKSRPYLVLIFREKYDYFLLYFGCFWQEISQDQKSKDWNENLT